VYADFLVRNRGRFAGVILCLPNFGDETGAVAAWRDAGVPILVAAYPDELDKMGFSERRDAFCGKFSIMDVFCQYRLPFTAFTPAPLTFASAKTEDGRLVLYLGEGAFTADPIADDFFGCAGVAQIADLQRKLLAIGRQGYRHHVSVTTGHTAEAVREAFVRYLDYTVTAL
jgi:L-fucose isomerase-like protein